MSKTPCATVTFFQSTSNSSAISIGIDVFTPCPISGFGEKMVTYPLSEILINALKSLKFKLAISIGIFASSLHAVNKLNPINIPPPAKIDVFKKLRRLKLSFSCSFIFSKFSDLHFHGNEIFTGSSS